MSVKVPILAAVLSILAASPSLAEEVLMTRDGTVYVGDLAKLSADAATLELSPPAQGTHRIQFDNLTDTSLWQLRSTRVAAGDGHAMLELGAWAEKRGLLLAAAFEYRKAATVPGVAAKARLRMSELTAKIARKHFARAEALLADERPDAARAQLKVVVERYPDTQFARAARARLALVASLISTQPAAVDAQPKAGKSAIVNVQSRAILIVERRLSKAARYEEAAIGELRPVRRTVALEKAAVLLENAWSVLRKAEAGMPGAAPAAFVAVRSRVRVRLIDVYMRTGRSFIARRSLNQAQQYCVKLTRLGVDHERSPLHKQIMAAQSAPAWAGPIAGRLLRGGKVSR